MSALTENLVQTAHRVFLSYSTKDEAAVAEVKSALQGEGLEVFDALASQREMWGSNIGDFLREVIMNQATGVVVFLSRNYQESTWCQSELHAIETATKGRDEPPLILPIRVDDSPVPEQLRDRVYLELNHRTAKEIAQIAKERLDSFTGSDVLLAALSDEALYRRFVQTRDPSVANLLFERLYPMIRAACVEYGVRTEDAEDIAQETLVSLLHKTPDFTGRANFRSWVRAVARNSAVRFWRRSHALKREFSLGQGEPGEPSIEQRGVRLGSSLLSASPSPEDAAQIEENIRQVNEALETLSPEDRRIVVLHYVEGLSYDEISKILGKSPATLRVRLYRTLQRLRNTLQHQTRNV